MFQCQMSQNVACDIRTHGYPSGIVTDNGPHSPPTSSLGFSEAGTSTTTPPASTIAGEWSGGVLQQIPQVWNPDVLWERRLRAWLT